MARPKFVECPICDTEVALEDAKPADEVFCGYCGAPIKIVKITDEDEVEIEDY